MTVTEFPPLNPGKPVLVGDSEPSLGRLAEVRATSSQGRSGQTRIHRAGYQLRRNCVNSSIVTVVSSPSSRARMITSL